MQQNKNTDDINEKFGVDRKNAIALILKDLREKNNMTQKELAKILYVTDSTISHYEQGINVPTTEMVIKLAKLFDVTTDYLLNNCNYSVNYSKILNKKLGKDITIGKAISIMLNATKEEKDAIAGVIKMAEKLNNNL